MSILRIGNVYDQRWPPVVDLALSFYADCVVATAYVIEILSVDIRGTGCSSILKLLLFRMLFVVWSLVNESFLFIF